MLDYDTGDVVLLQLEGAGEWSDPDVVPPDVAIPGISTALEVSEERISERVSLLSALDDLKRAGLVEEHQMRVRGLEGERNVYFLTEEGRDRARGLRQRLADRTVVVRDGGEREVALGDIDEYLPDPALPRALSRLTDDGVLYLEEEVGQRFVNREAELARLNDALADVEAGEPRAVLVGGEAGVGKTTLVTDELAATAREDGVRVSVGRCQAEVTEPYGPVRNAVGDLLATDPFVRDGPAPSDASQLAAERTAMFEDVTDALAAASEGQPLMVVVDDLHSADDPTLELFEHLADTLHGNVLLVGTYRPEDLPSDHPVAGMVERWTDADEAGAGASKYHLQLDPFGRDETRQLVEWLVGRRGVPAAFVDRVYELTGGNPLFVKESVTRLIQKGTVDPEHGLYPDDPDDIPVSDEVEDTIDIRLSVLDEATHDVLDLGGVIGQSVPFEVLAAATDADEAQLREHVDLLVDSHIWERAEGEDERLRFASGLMRETVFDRIPVERRRELHARIADAVAESHGDDPDYHATIAHHYQRAGDPERAFEFYIQAADHAKSVYAHEVALDNYDRALELAREELDREEDDDQVLDVLKEFAETYYLLGEYDEADRYYRYVEDRATDLELLRRIAHVRIDMLDSRGRYDEALEVAENAIEEYGVADTRESCHLFGLKGGVHLHTSEFDAAEEAFQRCLEIAERIEEPEALASAYLDLGALDVVRGEADEETLDLLERAVSVAEEGDDDRPLARALNNLAMLYNEFDRTDDAEETFRRCLELKDEMGDRVQVARAHSNLGKIQRNKGEFEAAVENTEKAIDIAESVDNVQVMATGYRQLSALHHALGRIDRAIEHSERALELVGRLNNPQDEAVVTASLADSNLDGGNLDHAEKLADDALDIAQEYDSPAGEWIGLVVLGEIDYERGDYGAAREHFEAAIDVVEKGMDRFAERRRSATHASLAEAALAEGDVERAAEQVERARENAEAADEASTMARADLRAGALARTRGEFEKAERLLTSALETSREPHNRDAFLECRAILELGRLERDRGRPGAVREYAEEALEMTEEGGMGRFTSHAREILDDLE
ncbi:hypothetical protein BRD00_09985 [Halobacteriales archaeon QS_8_69_26]|nr:MAG: hypothetical protein BRD00_09985 [Halobacteriales archaeon QS_8_69_26]